MGKFEKKLLAWSMLNFPWANHNCGPNFSIKALESVL